MTKMTYRYFTAIYWPCLVFFIFWQFSNATLPDWCNNPMPIENFEESSQINSVDFGSNGIPVHLCQVDVMQDGQLTTTMFKIWDGVKNLFDFPINDVKCRVMSGNTFGFIVNTNNGILSLLKGRFVNFDDFKKFHHLVKGEDFEYSPQNFTIVGLESYTCTSSSPSACLTEDDLQDLDPEFQRLITHNVVFSQYFSIIDQNDSTFIIEDELFNSNQELYLSFKPSEYRSTPYQIRSQVMLTCSDDENKYFIIRFDTPENALSFASYIRKFAVTELSIPNDLENILNTRT